MTTRGKYIVIEGADGTGKSTQVYKLQKYLKDERGIESIQIHEPDGFAGDRRLGLPVVTGATELRKIIKNGDIKRDPWTNVILFTAARRLNWTMAMQPALDKGIWVLAARSYLSTVAYQGYGEEIDIDKILKYTKENVSAEYMSPDLELILTLGSEVIRGDRITNRGSLEQPDTFESKPAEFQAAMQDGYLKVAQLRNIPVIDASNSIDEVQSEIRNRMNALVREI